ncbi:hypothetical protein CN918_30455 [Priestia megaterium]|nr:hypothetical protein CN918_30455 [Priestia megaterium]
MEHNAYYEAKHFLERAKQLDEKYIGRQATQEEINRLVSVFGNKLPEWYIYILQELPLIGLEVGWQADEPEDDYNGIQYVDIYKPAQMIDESTEAYPGIPILEKGYVCIGGDPTGSGDPYFIDFSSGDGPVYQVYHDVGVTADDILKHGRVKVADSLAEFFRAGIVLEY